MIFYDLNGRKYKTFKHFSVKENEMQTIVKYYFNRYFSQEEV